MNGSQVQQEIERFTQDTLWFDDHRQEMLQQYPERWVAIYNKQVVGSSKDLDQLVGKLERKWLRPGHVFCDYVTDRKELLIL
jgi:hypothetical protein